MTTTTEPLWTLDDAAQYLRKKRRWLQEALKTPPAEDGSIPHFRVGKSPRFNPDVMRAWTAAGCPPAATFQAWLDRQQRKKAMG